MSEKTLTFNNIKLNKKEFHKSKKPIGLLSVDVDRIVLSDKFNGGFKYSIGYLEEKLVKPYVLFYIKWVGI